MNKEMFNGVTSGVVLPGMVLWYTNEDWNLPLSSFLCRILSLEKLGVIFNQVATPLQFTPRKLAVHPPTGNLVLLETDHNTFTEATKAQRKQLMAEVC